VLVSEDNKECMWNKSVHHKLYCKYFYSILSKTKMILW